MFRHAVATAVRRRASLAINATRRTPPRQGQACRCLAATPEPPQRTTSPQPKRSKPEALLALARVDAYYQTRGETDGATSPETEPQRDQVRRYFVDKLNR